MIANAATDWGITIILTSMIGFGIWGAWVEYKWHRDQERKWTRRFRIDPDTPRIGTGLSPNVIPAIQVSCNVAGCYEDHDWLDPGKTNERQ